MNSTMELRMPEDADTPCQSCNRRFLRAEAHWFCSICRKKHEKAKCPDDCLACIAMEEEDWRKKALADAEYKKASYYSNKNKGVKGEKSSFLFCGKRKAGKNSPRKKPGPKPGSKFRKGQASSRPVLAKPKPKPKPKPVSAYLRRLKEFETFLYEDLNPTIPSSLVEKGFVLPPIPTSLRERYDVARSELIRLLATSSMCYHLSKNRTQFCDENNQIFNANSDGIVSLFASLIKFKANTLGKVIFEIRASLLSRVSCANPKVISQMIKGPIKPKDSFFGNIDTLKEAVAADKENVLRIRKLLAAPMKNEISSDELDGVDEPRSNSSDSSY